MKTKIYSLFVVSILFLTITGLQAQIAINNSATNPDASAILDLQSGNTGVLKGFLPQAVALSATNVQTITSPATGLIVYNTATAGIPPYNVVPGYYYWNGTAWLGLGGAAFGSGTNNYIARWTPNSTTLGIGLIQDNGTGVGINSAPVSGDMLFVNSTNGTDIYATTTAGYAVHGYSSDGTYSGLYGENDGTNGTGVIGYSNDASGVGVSGVDDQSIGVYGEGIIGGRFLGWQYGLIVLSGSVGIGTTSPLSLLDVNGGMAVGSYAGNNAAPSNGMIVSGSVGIGTSAPTDLLTVTSTARQAAIYSSSVKAAADSAIGTTFGIYGLTSDASGKYAGVYGEDDQNSGNGVYGSAPDGYGVVGQSVNGSAGYFSDAFGDAVKLCFSFEGMGVLSTSAYIGGCFSGGYYGLIVPNGGGKVGFGVNTPLSLLDVNGGMAVGSYAGNNAAPSNGMIVSGSTGFGTSAPTTSVQVGNGITSGQKLSVNSTDLNFGQFQIGNPTSNAETSIGFISGATAFGDSPTSTNGNQNIWSVGAGAYGIGGNKFDIGNLQYGGAILTLTYQGLVGVGTIAPVDMLDVNGTAGKPGGGSWSTFSDKRLKQEIKPYTEGLEQLLKINPVTYHYNSLSGYDPKPEYVGVIAQELKEIAPYMVGTFTKDSVEYYKVDNSAMTYMLINGVKAQQKTIVNQQASIDALKKQVTDLANQVKELMNAKK